MSHPCNRILLLHVSTYQIILRVSFCLVTKLLFIFFFHPCGPGAYMPNPHLAIISSELYSDLELIVTSIICELYCFPIAGLTHQVAQRQIY
jgi:hypothetical protein